MVRLNQYNGTLEPAEVAEGMNAAARSARRLQADAEILLEHERYPSAMALATLAIEEAGKISILRSIAVAESEEEAKESWRDFRWHTEKNKSWIVPRLSAQGASHLHEFAAIHASDSDHPELLDVTKQLALYVDCVNDAEWTDPEAVIDESTAREFVDISDRLAPDRKITSAGVSC